MRQRLSAVLFVVALAAGACSPSPSGPSAPAAPDQIAPDDAVKATGARAVAAAFVRAYASDTGAHPRTLARLVDGDRLRRWVFWLGIQDREFPGSISGVVDSNQIGPAAPFEVTTVPGSDAFLRDVDVRATITFSFRPDDGEVITFSRSLDGPMRLLYDDERGTWSVLDFTRDGIPLSRAFEIVRTGAAASRDGVNVVIDSFVSVPYWQFFLRVSSDSPVRLTPRDVQLVDADGARVATAREVTSSLRTMAAGPVVEGIVTFGPRDTADGLMLRMTLRGPDGPTRFDVRLRGLIHPIPVATTSPSPSP